MFVFSAATPLSAPSIKHGPSYEGASGADSAALLKLEEVSKAKKLY